MLLHKVSGDAEVYPKSGISNKEYEEQYEGKKPYRKSHSARAIESDSQTTYSAVHTDERKDSPIAQLVRALH